MIIKQKRRQKKEGRRNDPEFCRLRRELHERVHQMDYQDVPIYLNVWQSIFQKNVQCMEFKKQQHHIRVYCYKGDAESERSSYGGHEGVLN